MDTAITVIVLIVIILGIVLYFAKSQADAKQRRIEDAKAEARRWVERLGGQVLNLSGTDTASQQAMADASERYNAAGSQLEQALTAEQAKLVTATALEGLYYVRAARLAMDMDPGPELPSDAERERAGKVNEHRSVEVEGRHYEASPEPGRDTPYYYPGGRVAGRAVPQGWYSEPWWKPAMVAGAWGMGSMFLFSAMFVGMAGVPAAESWEQGGDAMGGGMEDMGAGAGGEEMGGMDGMGGDMGGMGDMGGGFDLGGMGF